MGFLREIFKQSKTLVKKFPIKKITLIQIFSENWLVKKLPVSHFVKQKLGDRLALKQSDFFNQSSGVYFLFLFFGLVASLGIFYFMSLLVSTGKNPKSSGDQGLRIEFLLNTPLDELELRSRRLLKKPKEEEPPPETPKLKIRQMEMEKPKLVSSLPQLELPDNFQPDSQGALVSGQGVRDSDVTPVFRMNPEYPMQARLKNIEGFVVMKFDITETGQTDNISVMQASPPQIFNSSAIRAIRKWKYKPKIENGKAVRQNNLRVTVEFNLSKDKGE